MKYLTHVANPLVLLFLIGAFFYVYFVYLRGADPFSSILPLTETATEGGETEAPPAETNAAALAGPLGRQENPINPLIQPNVTERANPLEVPPDPNIVGLAGPLGGQPNPNNPFNRLRAVPQPNPAEAPPGNMDRTLAAQPNQNTPLQPIAVPFKTLQEGHWIGLEAIPLTATLAEANSIPPEVVGVLIDEVTLLSAEAGILAGDVITAVNGKKVTDLKTFRQSTQEVAQSNRATVSVFSGGNYKDVVIFSTEALGVAQMEAAPMILATDRPPHGFRGPCDRCHTISKTPLNTGQLAKDLGDTLTKVAPTIRRGTPPPHRNRGTCTSCHVVL